mgnify:CR=1
MKFASRIVEILCRIMRRWPANGALVKEETVENNANIGMIAQGTERMETAAYSAPASE